MILCFCNTVICLCICNILSRCLFYESVELIFLSPNFPQRINNLISKRHGCIDKNTVTTLWPVILFKAVQFHEWASLMQNIVFLWTSLQAFILQTHRICSDSLYISDLVSLTLEPHATSVKPFDKGKWQRQEIIPSPMFLLVWVHFMVTSRTQLRQNTTFLRFLIKRVFHSFHFHNDVKFNIIGNHCIYLCRSGVKNTHILYLSSGMNV